MGKKEAKLRHYLTFYLCGKPYAISVLKIVEVQESADITRVPRMPAHVKGVLNLRGSVVPVMDLRDLLELEVDKDADSHIVILELDCQNDKILIGGLVDRVDEVIEFKESEISGAPEINQAVDSRFIQGMVEREEGILIILDIERVIGRLCMTRPGEESEVFDDTVFVKPAGNEIVEESEEDDEDEIDEKISKIGNYAGEAPVVSSGSELDEAVRTAEKLDQLVADAEEAAAATVVEPAAAEVPEAPEEKPAKKKRKPRTRAKKKKKEEKDFTPDIPEEDQIDELD